MLRQRRRTACGMRRAGAGAECAELLSAKWYKLLIDGRGDFPHPHLSFAGVGGDGDGDGERNAVNTFAVSHHILLCHYAYSNLSAAGAADAVYAVGRETSLCMLHTCCVHGSGYPNHIAMHGSREEGGGLPGHTPRRSAHKHTRKRRTNKIFLRLNSINIQFIFHKIAVKSSSAAAAAAAAATHGHSQRYPRAVLAAP